MLTRKVIKDKKVNIFSCIQRYAIKFKKNKHLEILHKILDGNFLLNIGPTPEGLWEDAAYERLEEIGSWLQIKSKTKGKYTTCACTMTGRI